MITKLYTIRPRAFIGTHVDEAWAKSWLEDSACPKCHAILFETRHRGFDIYLTDDDDVDFWALNTTNEFCIRFAHKGFLQLFGEDAICDLNLGRVFLNGELMRDHATFIAKYPIVLRGDKKDPDTPPGGVCQQCKRFYYGCYGQDEYFVRSQLPAGKSLFQDTDGYLVVTQELKDRIDRRKWKGITIKPYPVVEQPKDGIDDFPEIFT